MSLWRVLLTVAPSHGHRKARVHEYVVMATCKGLAEQTAIETYRPDAHEVWTVFSEAWESDIVERRIYLEGVR